MSSDEPRSSQSQLYPSQSASSSSRPSTLSYCYPSAIIESLHADSATRDIPPTIPGPAQFGHSARRQSEGSVESAYPGQGLAIPSSNISHTRGDPRVREYDMSSYPIMGQEAYLPGQLPQNPNVWPNRPPRSPTTMDQSIQQSQLLSSGYMGYNPQSNPAQGYYQGRHSGQYLSSQHDQLRSPPTQYGFSNSSMAGSPSLPDQPFVPSTSQNYMLNHPDYYLQETSSVPSLPVSPQPPSQTIYSSPDSASATTDLEHPHPPHSHLNPRRHSHQQNQYQVRVVSSRPRPQCWEHGCNGREFSTFSNLLRHQREKSGAVAKAECPVCGAVFTRSTARNIHVAQGKCKGAAGGDGRY